MKSSENFIEAICNYLDSRAKSDNLFAIHYADPSKSLSECCQFILNEVKRQGVSVMTNDEIFSLATHYWDGDCTAEEIGSSPLALGSAKKPINCKVVISKDQLTEEDKAELKEQAMEQYKEEQLRNSADNHSRRLNPSELTPLPKSEQRSMFNPIFLTSKTTRI